MYMHKIETELRILIQTPKLCVVLFARCFVHDNRCNNIPFFVSCRFLYGRFMIKPAARNQQKRTKHCGLNKPLNPALPTPRYLAETNL